MKTIQQWQKDIDILLQSYEKPYWAPLSQFARLTEEVGEIGRILNHIYGDKPPKQNEVDDLEDEIGDVLWSLLLLSNSQNIDLDTALNRAYKKLVTRDKNRFNKR